MNTLEELVYYCRENEPVGALLLTGEWGCGKTYLIENKLSKELQNEACVIRVSLFGLSSLEEIHLIVKQAWMREYYKYKGVSNVAEIIQKGKEKASDLKFLPEWLTGVVSTNWTSLVEIKNKIGDKLVILVFDDLERCCINSVDVLGVVNDYCENRKFHTIIVANQDKMQVKNDIVQIDAEITINNLNQNVNNNLAEKKAMMKIQMPSETKNGEISYTEIKEKIIQRTVKYVPVYEEIVHTIIAEMKYEENQDEGRAYKTFVENCENGLLELFAPESEVISDELKRPHNIRSLKCAIRDFYRVYKILLKNNFEDIDKWFYCFASYIIAYKADIAKEGVYGTIFSDEKVHILYPAFQNKYILRSVKDWILHGEWNEDAINFEIEGIKEKEKAKTPEDIIRTHRIMDIDEEIINEGYLALLTMAYEGRFSLDEYVLFIENSCWARRYDFSLPVEVEWSKIQEGIRICIKKLIDAKVEGQQIHMVISEENKNLFTDDEWKSYQLIETFRVGDILMFNNNKVLYIEGMKTDALTAFFDCQNKRFKAFDEEMAVATVNAYANGDNAQKHIFVDDFIGMWRRNITLQDIDEEKSLIGFCKLLDLLQKLKEELQSKGKSFAVCHTENFVKGVTDLVEQLENRE